MVLNLDHASGRSTAVVSPQQPRIVGANRCAAVRGLAGRHHSSLRSDAPMFYILKYVQIEMAVEIVDASQNGSSGE